MDEDAIRNWAGRSFDRGLYPIGLMRQFAAVIAAGDWSSGLAALDAIVAKAEAAAG